MAFSAETYAVAVSKAYKKAKKYTDSVIPHNPGGV